MLHPSVVRTTLHVTAPVSRAAFLPVLARAPERARLAAASLLSAALLSACAAPPPVDFGGNWAPVNRFQETPQEVPLYPAYTYYASPLDGTLRNMLKRWADDNALPLIWQLNSDYTLHKGVAKLRATDLQAAIGELNAIYAAQNLTITADAQRILVKPVDTSAAATPSAAKNTRRQRPAKAIARLAANTTNTAANTATNTTANTTANTAASTDPASAPAH